MAADGTLTVTTPENVDIEYAIAGIGSRFVAAAIDHLVQVAVFVVGALILVIPVLGGDLAGVRIAALPFWLTAALIIWSFLVFWGYFAVLELVGGGVSPGKRVAGLRVLRDGGLPVDAYAVIVRNLVRMVDLVPPPYGFGVLCMLWSRRCKRLGDWAAGTVVIKERHQALPRQDVLGPPSPTVAQWMRALGPAAMDADACALLRRFVARRRWLTAAAQADLAQRLAPSVIEPGHGPQVLPPGVQGADLLEALLRVSIAKRDPRR